MGALALRNRSREETGSRDMYYWVGYRASPPLESGRSEGYTMVGGGEKTVAEPDDKRQRQVYYRGMVQGVGFRYTTLRIASRFAVTGYVQNLPDGRVLVLAEGPSKELERFLGAVRAELGHYIDDTSETAGPATGRYGHFDVQY